MLVKAVERQRLQNTKVVALRTSKAAKFVLFGGGVILKLVQKVSFSIYALSPNCVLKTCHLA
jgi:polysaccharide pyruvyl transferase WcaK-like protein